MRRYAYSFGQDSPVTFSITDKLARHYNAAVAEFLRAQTRFNNKYSNKWDPSRKPIKIKWSRKQIQARNTIIDMVNARILKDGIDPVWDFTDDYLVKVVGSAAMLSLGGGFDLAVRVGVIHGIFMGSKK